MALPTTIINASGSAGYQPPFKSSGGNFYVLVEALRLEMHKATDPTDSWTEVDGAGRPSQTFQREYAIAQDGDVLHIASFESNNGLYRYNTFNMADDTWGVTNELIEELDDVPTFVWISIAVRSDGDIVVVYAGDSDQVMGGKKERVDMNIRTSGTWAGPVALDAAGDIHYGNPNCVKASGTDDIHIMFQRTTSIADPPANWQDMRLRTVDPSDVLSTTVTDGEDTASALLGMQNGVSWDDAGTERIRFAGATTSTGHCFRFKDDASADITTDAVRTEIASSSNSPKINSEVGIVTIAIDTADDSLHVLWSNADDSDDIYYSTSTDKGATWTTEAQELDAVSCNFISANIYVRGSDTVLAYVYEDDTVTKYNEKVLTVGLSATLTGTAVPTQTEADIVTGGKTIIITLIGDTFVTGTTSEDGIAAGSDSDKTGANKWDSLIKTDLDNTDVVLSVGDTVATITLPAFATYNTAETETITWTIPAASLTTSGSPLVATPTHTVTVVSDGGHPLYFHRMMR